MLELLLGGVDDRQQKTLLFHRIGLELLGGQPPSFTLFFYVRHFHEKKNDSCMYVLVVISRIYYYIFRELLKITV